MKFISTKAHGILDYLMGMLLVASPWVFMFYAGGNESWVPIAIGGTTILMAMLTDYEWGLLRKIPMTIHLVIDFIAGALLAVSPWLFGFSDYVYLPHVIFGAMEIAVVIFSKSKAYSKPRVVGYPSSQTDDHNR